MLKKRLFIAKTLLIFVSFISTQASGDDFIIEQPLYTMKTTLDPSEHIPQVGQSFITPFNGHITKIEVYADTDIKYWLHIHQGQFGQELHVQEIESTGEGWQAFVLTAPVQVLADSLYSFMFDGANVWYADGDPYPDGLMHLENVGLKSDCDLAFRVTISGPPDINVSQNYITIQDGGYYDFGEHQV